jgi:hypothetical protein
VEWNPLNRMTSPRAACRPTPTPTAAGARLPNACEADSSASLHHAMVVHWHPTRQTSPDAALGHRRRTMSAILTKHSWAGSEKVVSATRSRSSHPTRRMLKLGAPPLPPGVDAHTSLVARQCAFASLLATLACASRKKHPLVLMGVALGCCATSAGLCSFAPRSASPAAFRKGGI